MKKVISTGLVLLLLLSATSAYSLDRGHSYVEGVVDSIGSRTDLIPMEAGRTRSETYQTVTISGTMYKIANGCSILIETEHNGMVSQHKGALKDILPGKAVTAKRTARTLSEIVIEEWKK